MKRPKFTISPYSYFYRIHSAFKIVASLYLLIFYPFMAHRQQISNNEMILMIISESIFLIDIIVNFFLQPMNEEGQELNVQLLRIAQNYFFGRFLVDFFLILPHGIFMYYIKNMSALWLIKTIRLRDFLQYITYGNNKKIIDDLMTYKR